MSKEVWCAAGNKLVTLPDAAFNQSLLAPSVKILPCDGCEHNGHAAIIGRIASAIEAAELISVT